MKIDDLIEILERVKRTDNIYKSLKMMKGNALFSEFNDGGIVKKFDLPEKKWIEHIYKTICDCIDIIEDK